MTPHLGTTNLLLGILAAVSLLEAFAFFGVFLAAYLVFRRIVRVMKGIEERQVAPTAARVSAIVDDLKDVTATVKAEATLFESRFGGVVDWLRRYRRTRTDRRRS
jgi:hypothetical protein